MKGSSDRKANINSRKATIERPLVAVRTLLLQRTVVSGEVATDPELRWIRFGATPVYFSELEFAVAVLLVEHPGVMITREEICLLAWRDLRRPVKSVTAAIGRIRARLEAAGLDGQQFVSIHSRGYRWDPPIAVGSRVERSA